MTEELKQIAEIINGLSGDAQNVLYAYIALSAFEASAIVITILSVFIGIYKLIKQQIYLSYGLESLFEAANLGYNVYPNKQDIKCLAKKIERLAENDS